MMKTWLMRRPLRRPVSRATTAPRSSSVWRLPFISSSASPCRTSATAAAAAAWLCGASTMRVEPSASPARFATAAILSDGPTRIGVISPFAPASMAPPSAVSSHGCATAVGMGSRLRHLASSCSYFPVPGSRVMCVSLRGRRRKARTSRRRAVANLERCSHHKPLILQTLTRINRTLISENRAMTAPSCRRAGGDSGGPGPGCYSSGRQRMDDIAGRRLWNQGMTRTALRRPADVVAWMGAVQAQEYEPAKWALGLRLGDGASEKEIERAFEQGRILRTHVMRPTWHFVAAADIRWLLALTAPRVHRILASYNRRLGLETRVLVRSTALLERALRDRRYLTRGELGEHLQRAGLTFAGMRLASVAMYAELEGVICSGPRRGRQFTYALIEERALKVDPISRDEALAALSRRFFTSHGPATIRDFVWWSGLTTADARRGLDINRGRAEDADGTRYWSIGPAPRGTSNDRTVHLLPIYDEYLVAYRDRVAVPHVSPVIAPESRAVIFQHAVIAGGQIAGTWRIPRQSGEVRVDVIPRRRLTRSEQRGVTEAVERYARFTGDAVMWSLLAPGAGARIRLAVAR